MALFKEAAIFTGNAILERRCCYFVVVGIRGIPYY